MAMVIHWLMLVVVLIVPLPNLWNCQGEDSMNVNNGNLSTGLFGKEMANSSKTSGITQDHEIKDEAKETVAAKGCVKCRIRRFSNKLLTVKRKGKKKKGKSKVISMTEVEFPYSLQQSLDDYLMKINYAFYATASDEVKFNCQSEITKKILRKFPTSMFLWTFNSRVVSSDSEGLEVNGGQLIVPDAQLQHSGVYVCQMEFAPKRKKTVAFFSLVVNSGQIDELLDTRNKLTHRCPSTVFGMLYTKAFRIWIHNGEPSERMGKMPARDTTAETFSPLSLDMTGRWACVVSDGMTDREWTVAGFNLKVLRAPPMKKQTTQFLKKNPVMLIVAFVSVGVFALAFLFLLCYRASEKSQNKAVKKSMAEDNVLLEVIDPSDTSLDHIPPAKSKR